MKATIAEFFGTFWLVLGGCGSAVLAAAFPEVGIGLHGVSLAFGLTVLTMAYAIGHISGCHLNPAVSIGLWVGGRFDTGRLVPYIVAQVAGAVAAGGVLYLIASGKPGFELGGFASNGYGVHSPGQYTLMAALVCEVVMTAFFLFVIMGARWTGARGHRPVPDADPPDQHPGDQHLGQPGPLHRRGGVRGRLGHRAAVAVLGGAHHRRRDRRAALPHRREQRLTCRHGPQGVTGSAGTPGGKNRRSAISTAKKPTAAISVHFMISQPRCRQRGSRLTA